MWCGAAQGQAQGLGWEQELGWEKRRTQDRGASCGALQGCEVWRSGRRSGARRAAGRAQSRPACCLGDVACPIAGGVYMSLQPCQVPRCSLLMLALVLVLDCW